MEVCFSGGRLLQGVSEGHMCVSNDHISECDGDLRGGRPRGPIGLQCPGGEDLGYWIGKVSMKVSMVAIWGGSALG